MRTSRMLLALFILVVVPLALAACNAAIIETPEYAWEFEVTVTPSESTCVALSDAEEAIYSYGLVVAGSAVEIYSDDGKLADGTLTGRFIEYESMAPFTDRRLGTDGEPLEVEWTIDGEVLFVDQDLSASDSAMEIITVFSADEATDLEAGCEHTSTVRWDKTK